MILTLYRNCILNDKYYEVFDTKKRGNNDKSAFVTYLEGLDNTVIEVENVYVKYYGNILLPYDVTTGITALDYNYMKVENEEQTIYAFINSIELVNQVVNLTYAQDVWANWSDKCTIRQGVLSSLNNKNQVDVSSIPIGLAQNGTIYSYDENPDKLYGLVITFQAHNVVGGSDDEEREQWTMAIGYRTSSTGATSFSLSLNTIDNIIQTLLQNENKKQLCRSSSPTELYSLPYIDIVNYYLLPKSYASYELVDHFKLIDTNIWLYLIANESVIETKTYQSENIPNNIIGIGIIGNIIPYNNLSSDITLNLTTHVFGSNFAIMLEGPGILQDVTNLFEIEPYWEAQSDIGTVQRKIQYKIQRISQVSSLRNGIIDSIYGGITGGLNTMKSFAEGNPGAGLMNGLSTQGGFIKSIGNNLDNIYLYNLKNSPMYGNFSPLSSNGSTFLTAYFGLTMFCATVANNEFINNMLNVIGYDVQKYISNYDLSLYNNESHLGETNFCICKFSGININGSASQDVLRTLEAILSKTTKIYYNGSIS